MVQERRGLWSVHALVVGWGRAGPRCQMAGHAHLAATKESSGANQIVRREPHSGASSVERLVTWRGAAGVSASVGEEWGSSWGFEAAGQRAVRPPLGGPPKQATAPLPRCDS